MRDRFNEEQWRVVHSVLGALRDRLKIENQDREQKSVETDPIFSPRETDSYDVGRKIKSLAWHEAWGGLYLAGVGGNIPFLYPVVDGRISASLAGVLRDWSWQRLREVGSVSWIHANDRHYLVIYGTLATRGIYILEFLRSGELHPVEIPRNWRYLTVKLATSPIKVNGRDHIVATVNRDLVLIDPSPGGWLERTSISVLEGRQFGSNIHALHTVDWHDQQYIAGIGESGIFIYKIENESFIKIFESRDSYGSRDHFVQLSGGSIVASGDHILLAAPELSGSLNDRSERRRLKIFDFDLRAKSMRSFRLPNVTVKGKLWPSWVVKDGRAFLGLSYREPSTSPAQPSLPLYSYFEWTGDRLNDAGQFRSGKIDLLDHAIQWFDLGPSLYSAFGSDSDLYFLEHQDGKIVTSKSLPIPTRVSIAAGARYGNHGYVAIGNTESSELLIFDLADRKRIDSEVR